MLGAPEHLIVMVYIVVRVAAAPDMTGHEGPSHGGRHEVPGQDQGDEDVPQQIVDEDLQPLPHVSHGSAAAGPEYQLGNNIIIIIIHP